MLDPQLFVSLFLENIKAHMTYSYVEHCCLTKMAVKMAVSISTSRKETLLVILLLIMKAYLHFTALYILYIVYC